MRWPVVPRSLYEATEAQREALQTRYDALLEKYHALKLAGASAPSRKAVAVPPAPSPEEVFRRQAEDAYTHNVVEELIATGKSRTEATAIATELRATLLDLSPVPMDG